MIGEKCSDSFNGYNTAPPDQTAAECSGANELPSSASADAQHSTCSLHINCKYAERIQLY